MQKRTQKGWTEVVLKVITRLGIILLFPLILHAQDLKVFFSDLHIDINSQNNQRFIESINDALQLPEIRQTINKDGYALGAILGDNVAGFPDLNPPGWQAQYQTFLSIWAYALSRGLILLIVNGNHDLLRDEQGLCNQLFGVYCHWNQKLIYYLQLPTSFNIVFDTAIEFRIPGSFSLSSKNLLLALTSLALLSTDINIFGHHRLDLLNHEDGVTEFNQNNEPYIYDYIREVRRYLPTTRITYIYGHTHLEADCREISIDNKSIRTIQVGSVAYPANGHSEINYVYRSNLSYNTRYRQVNNLSWQERLLCN